MKKQILNTIKVKSQTAELPLPSLRKYSLTQLQTLEARVDEIIRYKSDIRAFLDRVSLQDLMTWVVSSDQIPAQEKINYDYYIAQSKTLRSLEENLFYL